MKASKKKILGITVAIVVVVFLALITVNVIGLVYFMGGEDAHRHRVLLLCKTDHQALLNAGREILSQVPKDHLNPRPDGERHLGDIGVPKGVEIPQAIRDLKPRGCLVSLDGYLTLEMHGGMDHFGVRIYPEDFKEPKEPDGNFKYGDRELLHGLWYYDDGYHYDPEKSDKRIDELIEEHMDNGNK